jgi:acetyl-CoA carboxylase biotin carboxyl carrier protein
VKIDLDQIRELLSVVSSTDVTELTIEFGDQRITVKKSPPTLATLDPAPIVMKNVDMLPAPQLPKLSLPPAEGQDEVTATRGHEESKNGLVEITSPMVGTFYQSPSPDAPPFIQIGDHVAVGQTVCIIEAMKLMNDMPAEVSGKVVKLLVDNGTTVEYGQPLFLVDPKG